MEKDPVSQDGQNRWQQAIDAWAAGQSDDKYKIPKETSQAAADRVVVKIKSPEDQKQYNEHDIQIEAQGVAKLEVVRMELYVDGVQKESAGGNTFSKKINLDTGSYEIKIKGIDVAGNSSEVGVKIGVLVPWNYITTTPSPPPTP